MGIRRFVDAVREYEVEADSKDKAEEKATELARNDDWSGGNSMSDYDTEYVKRA